MQGTEDVGSPLGRARGQGLGQDLQGRENTQGRGRGVSNGSSRKLCEKSETGGEELGDYVGTKKRVSGNIPTRPPPTSLPDNCPFAHTELVDTASEILYGAEL